MFIVWFMTFDKQKIAIPQPFTDVDSAYGVIQEIMRQPNRPLFGWVQGVPNVS